MADHKIGTRLLFAGNILRQPCAEGMVHRAPVPLTGTDTIMHRSLWVGLYPGLSGSNCSIPWTACAVG
jgi:CDP-6-deoxy-D-xylo-4-hexulose-3-dehydrase